MSKLNQPMYINHKIAKPLVIAMYFMAVSAIVLHNYSAVSSIAFTSTESILENTAVGLAIATLILGIFLKQAQKNVYSLWGQREELDERQRAIRGRVFERAYYAIITGILLGLYFIDTSNGRGFSVWLLISAIVNLPAMLAAFEKNS